MITIPILRGLTRCTHMLTQHIDTPMRQNLMERRECLPVAEYILCQKELGEN